MSVISAIVLFSLRSLLRYDILAWVVGLPVLIAIIFLLIHQYRQYRALRGELAQLAKMKVHSVEYELVLKAMKMAVFRLDVAERVFSIETDYRDSSDSLVFQPGSNMEAVYSNMLPEYANKLRQALEELMAGRIDVLHEQFQMKVAHSQRSYWVEGYATIDKRDLQGKPTSIVGTLMRIDKQKETESALRNAVFHAEESDRLKSAFLANISHEIRTPLNAIIGFSDILTEVTDQNERMQLIKTIKQNNALLLRLFDDIVSMSKLEARSGEAVKKEVFLLKDVFSNLIEKYTPQANEKGLLITIADEEQLPTLNTDRDRLREIINQYLNNALKFTDEGKVTLGCNRQGEKLRIFVSDTGKGIPEEKCNEQIFERFVKVDEFTAGTGLGLSICRTLASTLDGEVGVDSKQNAGSTFWVDLPHTARV